MSKKLNAKTALNGRELPAISLHERAMLVRLIVRGWSIRRTDRELSDEYVQQQGAEPGSGVVRKLLLRSDAYDRFNTIASQIRRYHHHVTSPWMDGNIRVLASKMYFDYAKTTGEMISEAMQHVDEFIEKDYEPARNRAKKSLGKMWKPTDYPPAQELRSRFGIRIHYWSMPDAQDWRIDLPEEAAKALKNELEANMKQQEEEILRDLWGRLHTSLEHFEEILTKGKRRDSKLVTKLEELADILPKMNIMGDPELDKLAQEVKLKLCKNDIKTLKRNDDIREETAKSAKAILKRMGSVAP